LWWVSGGRWLGFGDAKLVVGVGLLLGLVKGITALTLAFWIGAVVSIALLAFQAIYRKVVQVGGLRTDSPALTMKSEIPFAPFIILGTLIAFFWNADVFNIVGQLLTF
jgi:leader peptidase (prepilin peptidase)/N-methyltransferase